MLRAGSIRANPGFVDRLVPFRFVAKAMFRNRSGRHSSVEGYNEQMGASTLAPTWKTVRLDPLLRERET